MAVKAMDGRVLFVRCFFYHVRLSVLDNLSSILTLQKAEGSGGVGSR